MYHHLLELPPRDHADTSNNYQYFEVPSFEPVNNQTASDNTALSKDHTEYHTAIFRQQLSFPSDKDVQFPVLLSYYHICFLHKHSIKQ